MMKGVSVRKAGAALSLALLASMPLTAGVMPEWGAIGDDASANACVVCGYGQPPVRYGDLIRKGSVELPVDGPNAIVRWDFMLPCDLSNAKGVEFDIRCDDIAGLKGAMFYFKSGKGWYTRNIVLEEEDKWCHVRVLRSGCAKEGNPGGWDAIERMRINFFRSEDRRTTTAAIADFAIIPIEESVADVEIDRTRVDAEVREFVKSVPGKNGERRLAWCHSARGLASFDWDGSVRFLKEHGFTDLIANLAWADCAYYASGVLPVDPSVATKGDALEQCLAACRKWGVKCHVWRVCYNMGGCVDKDRVARFAAEGRLVKMFNAKSKSPWGSTFCPSHPENVRLEVSAMEELASKGVDGIHFDYIRYADQNVCFCDGCRERFERDCGVSVSSWPAAVRSDGMLAKKWADWRCSNITRVVREVAESVRRNHPGVEISAAVRAGISGAYTCDGQDWVGWAKNGWVDFLCPMDYTPSTAFFRSTYLDQAKAIAGTRAKLYPGIGLSCWPDDGTDAMKMAKHIQALRKDGIDGFTVFNFGVRAERAFPILSTGPTRADAPLEEQGAASEKVKERIELLKDGDISKHWYVWLKGEGRDSDPKKVFTAEGGTLKVSGEGMGCVTTRKAYRDYKLSLEFRYVDNEVQLNKTAARDGGILFHSTGEDGAFGPGIWMSSFEYNIIQGATGDLIVVGDGKGKPGVYRCKGRVDPATKGKLCQRWCADGEEVHIVDGGRIRRPDVNLAWKNTKSEPLSPNENPVGEWNKAEVVCKGDMAEFYFNGMKTGEYWDLNPSSGRIQLQSEGFGIEYRNIVLEPVDKITLEGKDFRGHVQGVCTDGTNIYWSMTYDLVKTDRSGRELARYSDKFHMGDLCWHDGRIYVGINRMAERGARRGDEVWVFETGNLERVKVYPTPQAIWCNNGIEWYGDRFWIIGDTPLHSMYNYVFEYTEDFKFVQCRPIESGWTQVGVQTICLWGDKMLFGCYGDTKDPVMPHKACTFAVDVKELARNSLNIEFPYVIPLVGKVEAMSAEGLFVFDGEIWTARGTSCQHESSDGSENRHVGRRFGAYVYHDNNLERKLAESCK